MPETPKCTDEILVQKSLEDVTFFGELVDRFEQKLKYYILRISSFSEMEAEEILQEVFVKVWKNLREFDGSVKFSSWIYRIAHNETISAFRKSQSRGEKEQVSLDEELFCIPSGELDIPTSLDQKLTAPLVHRVLNGLPKEYREVLVLKFLEDKSYEEISDILKKPMGTVATLINRAKKSFRDSAERQNITF
ncbi:sigma-70 family RNA polymerase sigma factor [Candidatus Gracilibacteria bacterium]|nr:sigma-70 family RNA polymerase sigma factor [Candidatus Gracilibacteria bacterium]